MPHAARASVIIILSNTQPAAGRAIPLAGLTHRLASLHNDQEQRVFDSVIVITDRRVLDQQLQDTIYQFEHRQGVVQKIDEDSRQLAQALESAVPVIVTTLQKFPFVSRQLLKLAEERKQNAGIRERELPEQFATDEYQVLLVAEKYQTGFDQPLLHTMYVDKRLAGIQAVQTLSRLNRIHPHKEDTFVLDFVNEREEIREAFKQFYEGAEFGEEAQPEQLYQLKFELDASGVYLQEEVERFCQIYFKPKQRQNPSDHQAMNATLDPAVDRFRALSEKNEEEAELWRGKLVSFRNLYSFLSQIILYQDSDLERLYIFLRHLSSKLQRCSNEAQYDFDNDVRLEYYRLQKISEGSINLKEGYASPLDGPHEVGTGVIREGSVALSQLIDIVNERFGTDFNQADQLFFDQIVEAATHSEELQQAAQVNSADKFALLFKRLLETLFVERLDQNEEIFARYMNDREFPKISVRRARLRGLSTSRRQQATTGI